MSNPFLEESTSTLPTSTEKKAQDSSQNSTQETLSELENMLDKLKSPEGTNDMMTKMEDNMNEMRSKMESTYSALNDQSVVGHCDQTDSQTGLPLVSIKITATMKVLDVAIQPEAAAEGADEMAWHVREALTEMFANLQQTTQKATMAMMEGMNMPAMPSSTEG